MPLIRFTLATAFAFLLLAGGCGPLKTRNAIPIKEINTATIPGFEHVRYWGDVVDPGLQKSLVAGWAAERACRKENGIEDNIAPIAADLAISGGGQDGAFGAGLLCGWSESGTRPQFAFVTGISTGALIAPFAFLGPDYDPQLKEVYTKVNMQDIAVFRGLFDLFRGDSAYNTEPLVKLAKKSFTHEMIDQIAVEHRKGRRLFVGTTNLDAQRPMIWDMGAIACTDNPKRDELFRNVLLASSAIPGAFSPVYLKVLASDGKMYDELHVDGGVTREMFLTPSELHVFELRASVGKREVTNLYIIRNSKLEPEYDTVAPKVAPIAERSIATLIKAQAMGDILQLYTEAKLSNMTFQLASIPLDNVDDSESMFDSKYMTKLFNRGFEMAKPGYPWQRTPHDWRRGMMPEGAEPEMEPTTRSTTTP